ncbi:MAG: hypothetical protein WDW36_000283 [Sanguina aurantia]
MNKLLPLRKLSAQLLRNPKTRAGGSDWPGGFWSEGSQKGHNGFLFGETPLPAGQSRQWQWWEPIWYIGYGGFAVAIFTIYNAKPLEALDIRYWAAPRAAKELVVEKRMLDKLSARPDILERLEAVGAQLNMIPAESYDLVLMRNEYKVKMGLHTGRVPAELAEIYAELEKVDGEEEE